MNVFMLKIIAIITMVVDHIGYCFYPDLQILRLIGRVAFPIYAFLMAQGLCYTKDKIKYFKRLLICGIISEIPFNLAFFNSYFYLEYQNVLVTFLIVVGSIIFYEKLKEKNKDPFYALLIGVILAVLLKSDYGLIGVIITYLFYFLSKKEKNYKIKPIYTVLICFLLFIYELIKNGILFTGDIVSFMLNFGYIYFGIFISAALLCFYNTKLGRKNKIINLIFYSFYPAHIIILAILKFIF